MCHLALQVIATEVSKTSVQAARHNIEANGVSNIFIARMASEEFAETWRSKGSRRRLADMPSWDDLNFSTILVDPPRAGAWALPPNKPLTACPIMS